MGAGASLQEGAMLSQDELMSFQDKLENNVGPEMKTTVSYFAMRQLSLTLANNSDEPQLMRSQSMPNAALPNGKIAVPRLTSLLELLPDQNSQRYREAKSDTTPNGSEVVDVKKPAGLFLSVNVDPNATLYSEYNSAGSFAQEKGIAPRSPRVVVSPRGTIQFGNIRIREDGISPVVRASSNGSSVSGTRENMTIPQVRGVDFLEVGALGNGSSGVVMEAVHVPTLTIVALKMLPVYNKEKRQHVSRELTVLYKNLAEMRLVDESLDGAGFDDDGLDNARMTSTSRCPNLLSMYNAFVDSRSGMVNLVVEYMDGGSLQDLVQYGGCQDELVLKDIARQTLTGLAFLHANKNVHRDIKPANILCSSSGVVKIADFGISKVVDGTQAFANSFVGTVCYMSPERITGDSYGFPSDIWSFGLTMLAVAKGRFPINDIDENMVSSRGADAKLDMKTIHENDFEGSVRSLQESISGGNFGAEEKEAPGGGGYWGMIRAICELSPPTPGPNFSEEFNHFIAVCLRKDPAERYTARSLLFDPFLTEYDDGSDADDAETKGSPTRRSAGPSSRGSSRPSSGRPGVPDESPFSQSVKMHLQRRGSKNSEELLQKASDKLNSASASAANSPVHRAGRPSDIQDGQCDIFHPNSLTLMDAIRLKHLEVIISKLIQRDKLLIDERSSAAADDKGTSGLVRVDSVESGYDSIEDGDMSSTVDDLFWKSAVDLNAFSPGKPHVQKHGAKQEKSSFNMSFNDDDSHSINSNHSTNQLSAHPANAGAAQSMASMMLSLAEDSVDAEEQLRQKFQRNSYMPNASFQRLNVPTQAPPVLMPSLDAAEDVPKWHHLARQLHLPNYVVTMLAEAKCLESRSLPSASSHQSFTLQAPPTSNHNSGLNLAVGDAKDV